MQLSIILSRHRVPNEGLKCAKCNKKITFFASYIPGKGEVCLNCWVEYAKKDEDTIKL